MSLPARGRPGLTLMMTVERELTKSDLINLELNGGGEKVGPPVLQRLRARHHTAARLLAEGRSHIEVANICSVSAQILSDRERTDPTFQGLIKYYQDQIDEVAMDDTLRLQQKLRTLGESAVDELIERFDDDGKLAAMPTEVVKQVASMALDRTVAPPKVAQQNVNVPTKITFNIGNRDIRPKEGNDIKIIEHENEPDD